MYLHNGADLFRQPTRGASNSSGLRVGCDLAHMQTFILRDEHVRLLRAASIGWNEGEWGAPTIDPKRPFGSGDLPEQMARILGVSIPEDKEGLEYTRFQRTMLNLYQELKPALQVVLAAGSFVPGTYVRGLVDGRHSWRRAEHPTD